MIQISPDLQGDKEVASWLKALNRQHLPRATANGINKTLLAAQAEIRKRMEREFTLRRVDWAKRSVKMTKFGKVGPGIIEGRLAVESPGGGKRSDVLAQHEEAGEKKPRDGGRLAIPDPTLTTQGTKVIPKAKRPKAFQFTPWGKGPSAAVSIGKNRTFLVKKAGGLGGIYQRTGRKTRGASRGARRMASDIETRNTRDVNIRPLYRFTASAPIEERLHFTDTGRAVVDSHLARNMAEALEEAIRRVSSSGGR
jgi:hypothetical protein